MRNPPNFGGRHKVLLLIATLVASLAKQFAVLLLRHTLATLLDYGTHEDLTFISWPLAWPANKTESHSTRRVPYTQSVTEQLPYKVIAEVDGIEIRHYPSYVLVQTPAIGDLLQAGNRAFGRLLQYISGANATGQKISMTAPVLQESQSKEAHTVSFVMPSDFVAGKSSLPNDDRLTVVQVTEHFAAVLKYRGSWNAELFATKAQELMRKVEQLGLTAIGDVYWARFDPPFKPGFMKRNEAIIKIQEPSKEIHEHQSTSA